MARSDQQLAAEEFIQSAEPWELAGMFDNICWRTRELLKRMQTEKAA